MPLTLEEIKTESGKDPELKKGILSTFKDDFVKGAESEGLVVRTKEQDQLYLTNHVNQILPGKVDEAFTKKFKESLDAMDAEIASLTGAVKGPHEKTSEFIKRAVKEFNAKGGDPVTKEKVTQLEEMLKNSKAEFEKKYADKENELFNSQIEWQVNGFLDKINIAVPVHLKTDEDKQSFVNQQKALIKHGFLNDHRAKKDDNGNVVFYEGDKPLMSTKDGKPKGAPDIIQEKYAAWFVPASHTQTGTGAGQNGTTGGTANGAFKNKEDIHKHLAAQGMDASTKEYYSDFQKLATENKIEI